MRPPATAVIGHLVWSRSGAVWAVWRIEPTPYVWLPRRRKLAEHARIRSLLAGLPAESLLLSVAARIDPGEVVEAMCADVDLEEHPGWVDVVDACLDRLEAVDLYRRRHYLCAQVPSSGRGRWARWWRSTTAAAQAGWGLAASPVSRGELVETLRAAEELATRLATLPLTPATTGEIRWLYARAARRGLVDEPVLAGFPEPRLRWSPGGEGGSVTSPSLAPLLDAVFQEGGAPEDEDRPRHRRYLRVASDAGVSYQTFLAAADAPQQFGFPGGVSEWLLAADRMPFPVDWAIRVRAVANSDAARSATRQQRELQGQVTEYDHDPAGPPPSLAAAMDAVDDERAALAARPNDPELQASMIFALSAERLDRLEQRAKLLQRLYAGAEWHLPRPTGGQLALFEAMLPGSATPAVGHDYRQYMLPGDLAAGMPFAGAAVGDRGGMLLGASRDAGCARPVLVDPAAGPRADRDGSIAAFGVLGTGKSYLFKRLAAAVLLRGGRMVVIDRTQAGEYVRFAHTLADMDVRTQVATIGAEGEGLLLDPVQVFDKRAARQVASGYLGLVLGLDPTSLEAGTADRAVGQVLDQSRRGRLVDVLAVLERLAGEGPQYRHARELALRLQTIAHNQFGTPAWDADGRSIDPTVDCTVVHLPNLAIPRREVLLSEHLSRRLRIEEVCSLGLLYLVAALARSVAFDDPHRFAAVVLDEAWALTHTLPGEALLHESARDGRKHNAAIWVASQQPDDLSQQLRDLISTRFLFGLTGQAATTGLKWLGVDADRDTIDLVEQWATTRHPDRPEPPECLLRDAAGRVGRIQVMEAETQRLSVGFESNPTRIQATTGQATAAHGSVSRSPDTPERLDPPTGPPLPEAT